MKSYGVALFGEAGLPKATMEKIAMAATKSPDRLTELVKALSHEKYRICQQAAWCLSLIAEKRPALIYPYFARFMTILETHEKQSPGTLRNTLRILKLLEIPGAYEEKIVYHCFELVEDLHQPIAIRAFSLDLLGRISLHITDIQGELRDLIDYHYDNSASGFKSSARHVLKLIDTK